MLKLKRKRIYEKTLELLYSPRFNRSSIYTHTHTRFEPPTFKIFKPIDLRLTHTIQYSFFLSFIFLNFWFD